jgi:glucoamylase
LLQVSPGSSVPHLSLQRDGDVLLARFLIEYADFLESHLERWTVADDCRVLPGVRHFIRILPTNVKGDPNRRGPANVPARPQSDGDPNNAKVTIANREGLKIAAKDLLDAGFLELVRYGIRAPNDLLITDSLRAIDCPASEIMVSFDQQSGSSGKGWRRYNEDGYGNHVDGGPFDGTGRGGVWPLLTANAAITNWLPVEVPGRLFGQSKTSLKVRA